MTPTKVAQINIHTLTSKTSLQKYLSAKETSDKINLMNLFGPDQVKFALK